MVESVPKIAAVAAMVCGLVLPNDIEAKANTVCNSKKVSDHHAIVPTPSAGKQDVSQLISGEQEILKLISRQVLMAVSAAHTYMETVVQVESAGQTFIAKGKTVLNPGWKAYLNNDAKEAVLPTLTEGQFFDSVTTSITEGKTKAPNHFTEDTLLSAMENAGAKEMPDEAERKGLGTPATRASILEKLVASGFVERKKSKKAVHLIPQIAGQSLIAVLPEQLQSPMLTAQWEQMLCEIERGNKSPDEFLNGISNLVRDLVQNYEVAPGSEALFPSDKPVVGKCPRCGTSVTESKPGFFCENRACRFGLWKDNRYLTAKHIILTKKMAEALMKDGKTFVSGMYSEKTGASYDAYLMMTDDGQRTSYSLEFGKSTR